MEQLPLVEESTPTQEPIRDVGTFWERLDEVLDLIKTGGTRMDRVEEILKEFPEQVGFARDYKSFLFQPERISVSTGENITTTVYQSRYDIDVSNNIIIEPNSGHQPGETYSAYRVALRRGLVNVKSIQLLSAIIPNPIESIPDNELVFFYYMLRSFENSEQGAWTVDTVYSAGDIVTYLGLTYAVLQEIKATAGFPPNNDVDYIFYIPITPPADTTRPNYFDINAEKVRVVCISPTYGLPPDYFGPDLNIYNSSWEDYPSLLATLNACANDARTASHPGDIQFAYNTSLRRFQVEGQFGDQYYLPCGNKDLNIESFWRNYRAGIELRDTEVFNNLRPSPDVLYQSNSGLTLNRRLGFTWNGSFFQIYDDAVLFEPYQSNAMPDSLWYYLRPSDPIYVYNAPAPPPGDPPPAPWESYNHLMTSDTLTANTYANLCHTSAVRVFCDVILGSTQQGTVTQTGLLSLVPINSNELGISFYQNNFNNPLSKIPKIITELGFRFVTDTDQPYVLPTSAYILLELAVEYL